MKKNIRFSLNHILILILFSIFLSVKAINIYEIKEDIPGKNYKKVSFESDESTLNYYFKYNVEDIPKSRIGAFRIDFDTFDKLFLDNQIYCSFFNESDTDDDLVTTLDSTDDQKTSCIGQFNDKGYFEAIIKYDQNKTKLGIILKAKESIQFTATVYIQTAEQFLETKELNVTTDETYSLIPLTLKISDFNQLTSKILLYSYKNELQMYDTENKQAYPEKLFCGNILSIYTDPNMVRQKYHNANYMVLLTRKFTQEEDLTSEFKFQVIFPSNYSLDYYLSNNTMGRSKNSPLSINMTECGNPYYFILNYNKPEKEISLYIDQIYGKIKNISVATSLSSITWNGMIKTDMQDIPVSNRKYILPKESEIHMDIYRIECEIPYLLNFYYVDETADIPELDYGRVVITTLKPYEIKSFPFSPTVSNPKLTIEVFNPLKSPLVYVDDGKNEVVIYKKYLIEKTLDSTKNPIIVKEKNGDIDTRIIIKVGYNVETWEKISDEYLLYYNSELNLYVFSFPNDDKKLNYTYADLVTKGINEGDNVKYCYGTNIGSAIIPSSENCYRVSKENSETLKFLNPFIMYKDYEIEDNLAYFVSLKPVVKTEEIKINPELYTYNVTERNFEDVSNSIIIDSSGITGTILTPPNINYGAIFVQIQNCDLNQTNISILNAYNNQIIIPESTISEGEKNFYEIYDNILYETALYLKGEPNSNVFVKHASVRDGYSLNLKTSPEISFNSELNQLEIESPFNGYETVKYTIFISNEGVLSKKGLTLCSFTEEQTISPFNKTVISYYPKISVNIIFDKLGLNTGDNFEILVYSEQLYYSKMVFLSDIVNGTVGKINEEEITEIKNVYEDDKDYVYIEDNATSDKISYYYSYIPENKFEFPVGAFSIEFDSEIENGFSRVDCAFVDEEDKADSMIAAIQDVIDSYNSFCREERSKTNEKVYNYIFRYSYNEDNKPRKLVIKLTNENQLNSSFNIYIRRVDNTKLEPTDFEEQREYRKEEEKKSIIPFIVDLDYIRGDSEIDYISKVLIYSQQYENQVFYLDEAGYPNAPNLLFTGNILLLYTNLTLAKEKYHTTKLILLSENIIGGNNTIPQNDFRFHTKMFKTNDQIEYFYISNPLGFFNYPLSLQINKCTNNKYYYVINYNKAINEIFLYLDLIFGSMKNIKIANELNSSNWDDLIENYMIDIVNYQISLAEKPTHVDIIELECNTPLLANLYYAMNKTGYYGMKNGDLVIKNLGPKETVTLTLDVNQFRIFYYSFSLYNSDKDPDILIKYKNIGEETFNENALYSGYKVNIPEEITLLNNGETSTRIIYKIGHGVESEWNEEKKNLEGNLYYKDNKHVYKFPVGDNEKNFTNVTINIKPMKSESKEDSSSIKFCYSTSIGAAIDISYENCFRVGENLPYSMTFLNPLIEPKNYKSYSNSYYITLSPYYPDEYISLEIKENKYDIKERNTEGVSKVIYLGKNGENSTILSILENSEDVDSLLLQMQLCKSSEPSITYNIKNALTKDEIDGSILDKNDKIYLKTINSTLIENELKFRGKQNDKIFTKYIGLKNYTLELQQKYEATFNENENIVYIERPILNEAFKIYILIGRKGRFNDYSLCTFDEKSENQYKNLADYVKVIETDTNTEISHYIDFLSFDYKEGDEFDLLVYAIQTYNSKIEVLYDIINGKVGSTTDKEVLEIKNIIDNNHVNQTFQAESSNYLFYEFKNIPVGDVASLRIKGVEEMEISNVGCIFVKNSTQKEEMISLVNKEMEEGRSICIGGYNTDSHEYNSLINAIDVKNGNSTIIIKISYEPDSKEYKKELLRETVYDFEVILRINGSKIDNPESGYNESEELTMVPYVLDLNEIRQKDNIDYVSKVLLFSQTREMKIYYSKTRAPVELFSGNIMVIHTNPDVVKEKYDGATTMILLTESFTKTQIIKEEEFRFKAYFFKSEETILYFVSGNPKGRPLNNPTSIEMLSCNQPYYYILNYNSYEGNRTLYLENIYGEVNTTKIATEVNSNDWYNFISQMKTFDENYYYIKEQDNYHFDVLEVTCKTPLLLNVYYTDPSEPKTENLDKGDITILSLKPGDSEKTLTFRTGLEGDFVYNFNVLKTKNLSPNVTIEFEDRMEINTNGIYIKKTKINYSSIKIYNNMETNGKDETIIIFKFGYEIDNDFTKIENDIYHLQTDKENLFVYKFKNGDDKLNYISVKFNVSTNEDNVKFCYATNLGSFIKPSDQNCFRVGKSNSYILPILNPYNMYKDYNLGDDLDYYISFQTVDYSRNITIVPNIEEYPTNNRNKEGYPSTITVSKSEKETILTRPSNNEKYVFIQMDVCTPNKSIGYEFYNAYYNLSLEQNGKIEANAKYNYENIENAYLDTSLVFDNQNISEEIEVFVMHTGTDEKYEPSIKDIQITNDKKNKSILIFNQPISGEEFNYTIYIDKKDYLKKKAYNLCSFTKLSKLAHYSESITSKEEKITKYIDFSKETLKGYEEYDALILAENGKLMILSEVFTSQKDSEGDSSSDEDTTEKDDNKNTNKKKLAIIIGVIIVVLIVIIIIAVILILRFRRKKNNNIEKIVNEEKDIFLPLKEI